MSVVNKTELKSWKSHLEILERLRGSLADAQTEFEDKYAAMSERAQEGERGEAISAAASALETIVDSLDSVIDELTELIESSES